MVRVKRGNVARESHNKILKFAKGFKGAHSRLFRTANQQVMKSLIYSYVGRKRRKRNFKKLWICRVNAAIRLGKYKGMKLEDPEFNYNTLKHNLTDLKINLNLKMLAQIALFDKQTFHIIVLHSVQWYSLKRVFRKNPICDNFGKLQGLRGIYNNLGRNAYIEHLILEKE